MVGCSADYCTNSTKKGFQMCKIPQAEKRRKIWLENINRENWVPGAYARICHAHFRDDMWEKTRNGKRRLKSDAIPTIFHNRIIPVSSMQVESDTDTHTEEQQCTKNNDFQMILLPESQSNVDYKIGVPRIDISRTKQAEIDITEEAIKQEAQSNENDDVQMSLLAESQSPVDYTIGTDFKPEEPCEFIIYTPKLIHEETLPQSKEETELRKKFCKLLKMFDASQKSNLRFKQELLKTKRRVKFMESEIVKLREQIRSNSLNKALSKIWNDDQINVLCGTYKKIPHWCNETLINAYKLRFSCGTAGYEEILRQNLPYPCIRTLTRKLENPKFQNGQILRQVLQLLKIKPNNSENVTEDENNVSNSENIVEHKNNESGQ